MRESFLGELTPLPADPLLGITAAYRADPRPHKLDLGVGVYKNEAGATPIMKAVTRAEERLLERETTKVYEGPAGNAVFNLEMARLALGDDALDAVRDRLCVYATPGGTGALRLAAELLYQASPDATVWLSDPTWANHAKLISASGFSLAKYAFMAPGLGKASLELILGSLETAAAGDVVLIQGPCHNPTGIDLSPEDWSSLAGFVRERRLMPLIDVAYQGLGRGLDEDMAGVRAFLAIVPEALVTLSASKNFGLYRERCGALMALSPTPETSKAVDTRLASTAREIYSMPPSHGAAIVAEIMTDAALAQLWREELTEMRERINDLRLQLSRRLEQVIGGEQARAIAEERGMFSLLPLTPEQTRRLATEQAVYMPSMGRINIAGLTPAAIDRLADAVLQVS